MALRLSIRVGLDGLSVVNMARHAALHCVEWTLPQQAALPETQSGSTIGYNLINVDTRIKEYILISYESQMYRNSLNAKCVPIALIGIR